MENHAAGAGGDAAGDVGTMAIHKLLVEPGSGFELANRALQSRWQGQSFEFPIEIVSEPGAEARGPDGTTCWASGPMGMLAKACPRLDAKGATAREQSRTSAARVVLGGGCILIRR
jgi:hypothetical protein